MIEASAFIAIEEALTKRLLESYTQILAPLTKKIGVLIEAKNYSAAVTAVSGLSLSGVFEENQDFIKYMTHLAMLFGASRVTPNPGTSVVGLGFEKLLAEQSVQTFRTQILYWEQTLREGAMQLIAQSQESEHTLILKENPYHDGLGRFSSEDEARSSSGDGSPTTGENPITSSYSGPLKDFIDFDAPIAYVAARNARIAERNASEYIKPSNRMALLEDPVQGGSYEGITDTDMQEAFSPDKVSVYMAMNRATLKKVLSGDEIKNSLQTGKGTFSTIGEERAVREKLFLGIKADPDTPEGFPKYGFVDTKDAMSNSELVSFGYGDIYLEFKNSIRERTTATMGDSYDSNGGLDGYRIPAPLDAMGVQQLRGTRSNIRPYIANGLKIQKNTGDPNGLNAGSPYIEAQIYGKLTTGDIKAIHLESKKAAKDLASVMKKSGVGIPLVPAKTHTFLKRLDEKDLDAWHKVSSNDLSKLGDSYINKGWDVEGPNLWAKGWKDSLPSFNLPKAKAAIAKYSSYHDVPVEVRREVLIEYTTEARKGSAGSLPTHLYKNGKYSSDGFTGDVFNEKLLESYQ